ncbi:hypothetical protein QR680_013200 [Steinernema hermaphroditum]|uniref:aralkylamine N-acetyltransferase n=1 Tax=Steinernema hermaphroditum TaxID=289476 RepID=A0AA39I4P5_9BILA|nr:hypothetical protein QR680_013200 [Steinernema hermaphroditum]
MPEFSFDDLEFRRATPDDFDTIVEFTNTVFIAQEPLCQAMGFSRADGNAIFGWIVAHSLKFPYTVLVFDRRSGDLVGYRVTSVWFRREEDNHFDPLPAQTVKSEDMGAILDQLKKSFWDLCPKEVNAVLRRELSCVRGDFQRRGIASRMAEEFIDAEELKAKGIGGIVSETSSTANQALLTKKGFKPLKEVVYGAQVDTDGSRIVPTELHDGATKLVLNFKQF